MDFRFLLLSLFFLKSCFAACPRSSDFQCRSREGACIPQVKWQDGIVDCPDGSDEECLSWQFDCKFGKPKCVSLKNVLDRTIDCASGFDEECPPHYFVCMDRSACIDPAKVQDGSRDCDDGSDEACPPAHFLCHDMSVCVPDEKFQDGIKDCPDGSDEECTSSQFECRCGEPRCIPQSLYSDGTAHCSDFSDEPSMESSMQCQFPRYTGDREPEGPIRPPMVPCKLDELLGCKEELGEACMVFAGAPRCVCQMGLFMPLGESKCIPAPPPAESTLQTFTAPPHECSPQDEQPCGHDNTVCRLRSDVYICVCKDGFFWDQDVELCLEIAKQTTALPSLEKSSIAPVIGDCRPDEAESCPGPNSACVEVNGVYGCGCLPNFVRNPATRTCVALVDECIGDNDCDKNAMCMDNPIGYECLCMPGFIDMSPFPQRQPGIKCTACQTEGADHILSDPCKLIAPHYRECDPTECGPNALCVDNPFGVYYTCKCKPGFADLSPLRTTGIECTLLNNECNNASQNDCHENADCLDLPSGYTCRCKSGFSDLSPDSLTLPGRRCLKVGVECTQSNECHRHAQCFDTLEGYECKCKFGYADESSGGKSGRKCVPSFNPCEDSTRNDCDTNAECAPLGELGGYTCSCRAGYVDISRRKTRPGRLCKAVVDECTQNLHDCHRDAICSDTAEGYSCRCRTGFVDNSPDPANEPGRVCLADGQACPPEKSVLCSPSAECLRLVDGRYTCRCQFGFLDASPNINEEPGRVCKRVQNECDYPTLHDCHVDAHCIDLTDGYTCACPESYRDDSPDTNRPGRLCTKTTEIVIECDVNDPLSCEPENNEVCSFVDGGYRCTCPPGVSRLPTGKCIVINECAEARLNTCHKQAVCIDTAESYTCQCKPGFADADSSGAPDKTGRICNALVNECLSGKADCDANADCVDLEAGFQCRCRPGFNDVSEQFNMLPGRKCYEAVNECLDASLNDCAPDAVCVDAKIGYSCECRSGFVDASPNIDQYPGIICNPKPEPPSSTNTTSSQLDRCDPNAPRCKGGEVCQSVAGNFVCTCPDNAQLFEDGTCKVFDACKDPTLNDCHRGGAICANLLDGFTCQCKAGWVDRSPDPDRQPGRVCVELTNECASPDSNDCSAFATCADTRESYTCRCITGYVDVSSEFNLPPGRRCANATNECAAKTQNYCDENADCVDTTDGYTCQCAPGFIDVSHSANLPPGRVCTVATVCHTLKVDLMFVIDGSGSIGSYAFKTEVLRFVQEFVELFDIGPETTRVGIVQYSDQIRFEFDMSRYTTKETLREGILDVTYLTGLTQTGAAIDFMHKTGFSTDRGARGKVPGVQRIAIVITDGRSQDNVTMPAQMIRDDDIDVFAIGVTDHVLVEELIQIAGTRDRVYLRKDYKDLDKRLRSLIQKEACSGGEVIPTTPTPRPGVCSVNDKDSCDRTRNEVCLDLGGSFTCGCPDGFLRHPITQVCGGDRCNPNIKTSCPAPSICLLTPYGNYRCACPRGYVRRPDSGFCVSTSQPTSPPTTPPQVVCRLTEPSGCSVELREVCLEDATGRRSCGCASPYSRNPRNNICGPPGVCDPNGVDQCDDRKGERCLRSGDFFICQCPRGTARKAVTGVCLKNECELGLDDCHPNADCFDTDDGYLCRCPTGYQDLSPDPINKPGRECTLELNECEQGTHNCSANANCINTEDGFLCSCKPGFVDNTPNFRFFPGVVCDKLANECELGLHDCSANANCFDTTEAYVCICKAGFIDREPFTRPGRVCEEKKKELCIAGNNDCDRNAECIPVSDDAFTCRCRSGFIDKSPNIGQRPGRVCVQDVKECDSPAFNDCDPVGANCIELVEGYTCACKPGYFDVDSSLPGRNCRREVDECREGRHDCDPQFADCINTPESFTCRCKPGTFDVSANLVQRPGRDCVPNVDECRNGQHDCGQNAECIDTRESYECRCLPEFIDRSPEPSRPGRVCKNEVNECLEPSLNSCHENAQCVDTPDSYECRCIEGFVDESPDSRFPGRVCRKRSVNECLLGQHDCHQFAQCIDLDEGYQCRCREGFIDQQPNRPGRNCARPEPTVPPTPPPDCQVGNSQTCRLDLNEVCQIVNGEAKCVCPPNYQRDPNTRACSLINECEIAFLNDCSLNADCFDLDTGYRCQCRQGYVDKSPDIDNKPGIVCRELRNECADSTLNDCAPQPGGECIDEEQGYTCRCSQGYRDMFPQLPGRNCRELIDECARNLHNCDPNAICTDLESGYECQCPQNYQDISPNQPGRICKPIVNECETGANDCDPNAICEDTVESYRCTCPPNTKDISPNPAFPGRHCKLQIDECAQGIHDCDVNARCTDLDQGFTCSCRPGFRDISRDSQNFPGRLCQEVINECSTGVHDCHENAQCRDLEVGYTCTCNPGFVDRSPNVLQRPGRLCQLPLVCPSETECGENSVCDPLPDGRYECRCLPGFVDLSPPGFRGRICRKENKCRDPALNDCSQFARCISLDESYTCECLEGFIDLNPNGPGRQCEQPTLPPVKVHPCQSPQLNDCHRFAQCSSVGEDTYTCQCITGYRDEEGSEPGTKCIPIAATCANPTLNDCHPYAICTAFEDGYQCKCRDGWLDQNPNLPGRQCKEIVNPCLDAALHDCDPKATCELVGTTEYTCRCQLGYRDISDDPANLPGRKCKATVNECLNVQMNSCSRFARCFDLDEGYRCECFPGFEDQNPAEPGRTCEAARATPPPINPCRSPVLNDCSRYAICRSTSETEYTCECITGYHDANSGEAKGRNCIPDALVCADATLNDCHPSAICTATTNGGFNCACRDGWEDENPGNPGRQCKEVINRCLDRSLNDCDANAECNDRGNGDYTCRCSAGFKDISPDAVNLPGRKCQPLVDECRTPQLNQCSRFARCIDLEDGYECRCLPGYEDTSGGAGRVCTQIIKPPPPRPPCQDPLQNDCHRFARCRGTSATSFTCECIQGYHDAPTSLLPGRDCEPDAAVCGNPSLNDCHPYATCFSRGGQDYECKCRTGWIDENPANPGRECREDVDECLDASLNDCATVAICTNTGVGYECACPQGYLDKSPPNRPGRICKRKINECQNFQLNDCSTDAICQDTDEGYRCACKANYIDQNPANPGRNCIEVVNECLSPSANDCDRNAECIDERAGFTCRCKTPYNDESPDPNRPGRICRYNECQTPSQNNCDKNAICQDTEDSYVCHCKEGYNDVSPDRRFLGRACEKIIPDGTVPPVGSTPPPPTPGYPCGSVFCNLELGELCIGGTRCECRQGQARANPGERCRDAVSFTFPLWVVRRDKEPVVWIAAYGDKNSPRYLEITDTFEEGINTVFKNTPFGPSFIDAEVINLEHPRAHNATISNGLWYTFEVLVEPQLATQARPLWETMLRTIIDRYEYSVGGTDLYINPWQPNPWGPTGIKCGDKICNEALGESCLGGQICGCAHPKGRKENVDKCEDLDTTYLALWVIRENQKHFKWDGSYINPGSDNYKHVVPLFKQGIRNAYETSTLREYYVNNEVVDIMNPLRINGTWEDGLFFNFTVYTKKGSVPNRNVLWTELIKIITENGYELPATGLFINRFQWNPFGACIINDCYSRGFCYDFIDRRLCRCPDEWRELNPANPGRECRPVSGYNECVRPEDNTCHQFAECIDLPELYTCKCREGYRDEGPSDSPGRQCSRSVCLSQSCSANMTCQVQADGTPLCVCASSYKTIVKPNGDLLCLSSIDVNECQLGIHDCYSFEGCIDTPGSYICRCPPGWRDGDVTNPGRICVAAQQNVECQEECGPYGNCTLVDGEITCQCMRDGLHWYAGSKCQYPVTVILIILFAIIFFLLGLCCLLFFLSRCRCIKTSKLWYREAPFTYRRGTYPWTTLEASSGSESGEFSGKNSELYPDMTIPRPKIDRRENTADEGALVKYLEQEVRIPRAKLAGSRSSIDEVENAMMVRRRFDEESMSESSSSGGSSDYTTREEIENRKITSTNIKRTEVTRAAGDATAQFRVYPPAVESATTHASASAAHSSMAEGFRADTEYDRSIGTMSVGGDRLAGVAETATTYSQQNRGMSEYTEREFDDRSDTTSQLSESGTVENGIYDKTVLVKKSHDFLPEKSGQGGTETYRNEVTTKVVSRDTKDY